MAKFRLAGGCQCGAIRYALHERPSDPHICHCRMCQKAFGSFFAALTAAPRDKFELSRGALSVFKSSDLVERGFCSRCGTPLTFSYLGSPRINVSIGSLDEPWQVVPGIQYGIEARLPYFELLPALPGEVTEDDSQPERWATIRATNHQHPDHDTEAWPPPA